MTEETKPKPSTSSSRGRMILAIAITAIVVGAVVGFTVHYYDLSKTPTTSGAPSEIKIGVLYASTGSYASSSMPEYQGLELWVNQVNSQGGIYVPQYNKTIPVHLYSYDDQSSTQSATTYYDQLITQDHVNFLVADFGSVLTAPAVSAAQAHHVLLIDVTGSSGSFFNASSPNPYVVLTSIPSTNSYYSNGPGSLMALNLNKIAVLYAENDFTQPLAQALVANLTSNGITPVYDQGYSTSTTDFSSLISSVQATHPQAVVEYGYPNNDVSFLNQLNSSGVHFNYTFTVFPGQLYADMNASVGQNMSYTYTFAFPPEFSYSNVNYGMNQSAFEAKWNATYTSTAVNFLSLAGYNAGLVLQKGISTATSLSSLSVRAALNATSGNLNTLMGPFIINKTTGAQLGQTPPIAQLVPNGHGGFNIVLVYPGSQKTGNPVYPAP